MKSLREQIISKCVHFNGIQRKTCEVGVRYDDVRDRSGKVLAQWPCLADGPGTCAQRRFPTDVEADAEVAEYEAAFAASMGRTARGECAHCGRKVERYTQRGNCAYANPCGHRFEQADADALNETLKDTMEGSDRP